MNNDIVLIADDAEINRRMLVKLLSNDYSLIEAENGREALDLLAKYGTTVSCIILDLVMPVLDGFGFLKEIRELPEYKNIPIIVATGNGGDESEVVALKLGAWDFITKPYNGEIIKFRLRNAIVRSQLSAYNQLKYLAEYDTLTGIYNKAKFFQITRKMLDENPGRSFAFIRFDIDRFQLINSFFGIEEGDKLLQYLGNNLKAIKSDGLYTYGRMEADVFAACFSYEKKESVLEYLEESKERVKSYNRSFDIIPTYGVYFLDDLTLPVSEMLDRAALAAKGCKGNYLDTIGIYDHEMTCKLEKEQEIINEMAPALANKQFCVYLQPKYSLSTNQPVGAEALVRWKHPKKGMISPGEFIPVFEKNGFISKVDYFVWETVCGLLRGWIDEGRSPLPISVNVSRVNIYNPNLVGLISGLTEKYGVPPRLLQLELTESAYMDNPQMMEQVVGQLHERGFTLLMDDFGSGYSSLSILKDVDVDVLKIDMRFFEKTRVSGRGENITASMIRMAKWLNIPVVAEGVETQEQIDFLRGVGCDDVQGYYFAKPMKVEEYETLIRGMKSAEKPNYAERYAGLNPDRLWSLEPEMLLLFSDDPSPKAIYEYDGKSLEVLRINKAFKERLGFGNTAADVAPLNYITPEHHEIVLGACGICAEKQGVETCIYRRSTYSGEKLWVKLTLQYVQRVGTKYILMGHIEDVTELKTLERKYSEASGMTHSELRCALDGVLLVPDVREQIAFLAQIFDVARLVDPNDTALIDFSDDGKLIKRPYSCFKVWDKGTRCENCISICATRNECRMTKYEFIQNDIFYVVSNPVTVQDSDGVRHKLALELVSHTSDHLTLAKPDGKSIAQLIEETQRKIYTDVLTGAYNRRYLSELLFSHHGQQRVAEKLGLVLLDLKGFKQINDRFGHAEGDKLLMATADKLRGTVRQSDSVIRYGGDEFVVTFTDCGEEQVAKAVERMRAALMTIRYGENGEFALQADFGYAYADKFDVTSAEVESMIRVADAEMYREKMRNKAKV